MSTYKAIRGKLVKTVTTDPTPGANHEGEMWYNTSIGALKVSGKIASAWSSGPTSSSPATSGQTVWGTQTAAALAGGSFPAPAPALSTVVNVVQEYNGSSWTTVNAMSQARTVFGAAGPQTSSVVFGGRTSGNPFQYTDATEEYDGTNWTGGGALGSSAYYMGAAGTQTAAFSIGGLVQPSKTTTQIYNGSSWTAAPSLPTGTHSSRGSGTTSATLAASAAPPAPKTISMEYDSSSWSTGNPTVTPAAYRGCSSLGVQTDSLLWGGEPFTAATEHYDGTNWSTEGATLGTPGSTTGGGGTGTTGLAAARSNPSPGTTTNRATEEFTAAFIGAKTVTSS